MTAWDKFLARIGATVPRDTWEPFRLLSRVTSLTGQQCVTTNIEDGKLVRTPAFHVYLRETFQGAFPDGVRFMLRFYHAPKGIRMAVADGLGHEDPNAPAVLRRVVEADSNGAGGYVIEPREELHEIQLSAGGANVVYQLVTRRRGEHLDIDVPVFAGWVANTANDSPSIGSMSVSATLAPLNTKGVPSAGTYVDTGDDPQSVLTIFRCSSRLLFPFVTNQDGLDTLIVISNTSLDWLGTAQQRGACTIAFIGKTKGDNPGPTKPIEQTSSILEGGEQLVFTVSGVCTDPLIKGAPGFQGFVVVDCEFRHARGSAMITNKFGEGEPTISQSYLAEILPEDRDAERGPVITKGSESS